jgi:hypothetical protein
MSSDNINAENRNALVSIPTNRINNLRAIARTRCCSFCRQPGHTINFCNDVRISNFELDCVNRSLLFETTEEPIYRFNQWLAEKYLESPLLVKSFAIRKCNCTLRSSFQQCIDSIKNYIFNQCDEEETDDFIPISNEDETNITENGVLALAGILMLAGYSTENITEMLINRLLNRNSEITKYNFTTTVEILEKEKQDEKCDCSICFENLKKVKFIKLGCNHEFCSDCLIGTIKATKTNILMSALRCAFCRTDIASIATYLPEINSKFDEFKM